MCHIFMLITQSLVALSLYLLKTPARMFAQTACPALSRPGTEITNSSGGDTKVLLTVNHHKHIKKVFALKGSEQHELTVNLIVNVLCAL